MRLGSLDEKPNMFLETSSLILSTGPDMQTTVTGHNGNHSPQKQILSFTVFFK